MTTATDRSRKGRGRPRPGAREAALQAQREQQHATLEAPPPAIPLPEMPPPPTRGRKGTKATVQHAAVCGASCADHTPPCDGYACAHLEGHINACQVPTEAAANNAIVEIDQLEHELDRQVAEDGQALSDTLTTLARMTEEQTADDGSDGSDDLDGALAISAAAQAALLDAQMQRLRGVLGELLADAGGRLDAGASVLAALEDEWGAARIEQALREIASYKPSDHTVGSGRWTLPGHPNTDATGAGNSGTLPLAEPDTRVWLQDPNGIEHSVEPLGDKRYAHSSCGFIFLKPSTDATPRGRCKGCLEGNPALAQGPTGIVRPPRANGAQRAGQGSSATVAAEGTRPAQRDGKSAPAARAATTRAPAAPRTATGGDHKIVGTDGGWMLEGSDKVSGAFPEMGDAVWFNQRLAKLAKIDPSKLYMPKVPAEKDGFLIRTSEGGKTAWLEQGGKQLPPVFTDPTNCQVDAMRYAERLARAGRR